MKWRLTRRRIILYFFIFIFILIARPAGFLLFHYVKDRIPERTEKNGFTNDASHLNETRVDSIVHVASGKQEAIQQIRWLIKKGSAEGKII